MSISPKLKTFLDKEKVGFQILEHSPAYTAMEIAGSQHVPGRQMVKSVIVKADDKFVMCVLPAIHYIDLDKLKKTLNAKKIELAAEDEIAKLFPDFEVGAEPPFGQLYGIKVLVDKVLDEDNEIVFNAGTHTDMVKMKFADFKRIVNPVLVEIGVHVHAVKG